MDERNENIAAIIKNITTNITQNTAYDINRPIDDEQLHLQHLL
jgi:hypothetical protein